jgi:hypothetical protein
MATIKNMAQNLWLIIKDPLEMFLDGLIIAVLSTAIMAGLVYLSGLIPDNAAVLQFGIMFLSILPVLGMFLGCFLLAGGLIGTIYGLCTGKPF